MSSLTQCTTCHTVFHIKKSDLIRSGGHAKCGVCGMVFNALEAQIVMDAPAASEVLDQAPVAENIRDDSPSSISVSSTVQTGAEMTDTASLMRTEHPAIPDQAVISDQPPIEAPLSTETDTSEREAEDIAPSTFEFNERMDVTHWPSVADSASTSEVNERVDVTNAIGIKPKRHGAWFGAISAVLILVLFGQITWHFRDPIVEYQPELMPILNQLCTSSHCGNALSHDIDALKISSSVFSGDKDHDHLFHVQLSILNQSGLPVAFPAISISLKNESEETISRKTIYPMDYLKLEKTLSHGIPAQKEWPITLNLTATSNGVSNYKILLFYPAQPD